MIKFTRSQAAVATIDSPLSPLTPAPAGNAVVAHDVVRRYGEGESASRPYAVCR